MVSLITVVPKFVIEILKVIILTNGGVWHQKMEMINLILALRWQRTSSSKSQLNTYSHYISPTHTHMLVIQIRDMKNLFLLIPAKKFSIIFVFLPSFTNETPKNLLSLYNTSSIKVYVRMMWIKERDPSLYFWIIPPSSSSSLIISS